MWEYKRLFSYQKWSSTVAVPESEPIPAGFSLLGSGMEYWEFCDIIGYPCSVSGIFAFSVGDGFDLQRRPRQPLQPFTQPSPQRTHARRTLGGHERRDYMIEGRTQIRNPLEIASLILSLHP